MKQTAFAHMRNAINNPKFWVVLLTLVAFVLRVWRLGIVPPGWRDDELINSLVISQKVLDGQWAVYYADASGHESLYHILNAFMLGLFGPGVAGIRLLSAILGTLTVPLTYLVGNRLYGWKVGLVASAGMAVSFWSLMYSRIGIRHISLPVFMLVVFYFFLKGLGIGDSETDSFESSNRSYVPSFLLAGLFMGLGLYTYFAARSVPVILLAATLYVWLFHRATLRSRWKGLLLMYGLTLLLGLPLMVTLQRQPESESRVQELAVPLVEAQAGNWQPLSEHVTRTLSMFHKGGDEEWLYNIPLRPVFGLIGATFFWIGFVAATYYALRPIPRLIRNSQRENGAPELKRGAKQHEVAGAFLVIWWLVGIAPSFASVPPASLGHSIVAQPAVYILTAVPIFLLERLSLRSSGILQTPTARKSLITIAALLLLLSVAIRDIPDYFQEWPNKGMTRFLYRAEIKEIAQYLNEHPDLADFGVSGLLAGPWDNLALAIDLKNQNDIHPRWYNPERAILLRTGGELAVSFSGYPVESPLDQSFFKPISGEMAGEYELVRIASEPLTVDDSICFQNGLCLVSASYDKKTQLLNLTWEVRELLKLPPMPLISNPPPPGVYSGPRLLVFSQLLDAEGQLLTSDDGLWVEASSLLQGDRFLQVHHLANPSDSDGLSVAFGLYDPKTGERILTDDGRDHLVLPIEN